MQTYTNRFIYMASAFGITPKALENKLAKCEHRGGYHFWIVCCADLMRYYAQKEARNTGSGKLLTELQFKADIQKAWLIGGPFDQFIESHLAEIKEQFMMQYSECIG